MKRLWVFLFLVASACAQVTTLSYDTSGITDNPSVGAAVLPGQLLKLTASGPASVLIPTTTSDQSGIVAVAVTGAFQAGQTIRAARIGTFPVLVDGACAVGNVVINSTTANSIGHCTTQGSVPSGFQAIGTVSSPGSTVVNVILNFAVGVAGGGGGGASNFGQLQSGTNTTAAMLVGTGGSLGPSGSGTITATTMPFTGLTSFPTVCTNQVATALSSSSLGCTTITSAYVNNSIAQTGVDINTSFQVTALHLAAPCSLAMGCTGVDLSASGGTHSFLAQNASHVISARIIATGDLPFSFSGTNTTTALGVSSQTNTLGLVWCNDGNGNATNTGCTTNATSFDHIVAGAPAGTFVTITGTGDTHSSDLLDLNLNGGSNGNAFKVDGVAGNTTAAGTVNASNASGNCAGASNGCVGSAEGTAPNGINAVCQFWPDSVTHRWKMQCNAGVPDFPVGQNTVDVLTGKTIDTANNTLKIGGVIITSVSGTAPTVVTTTTPTPVNILPKGDGSGNLTPSAISDDGTTVRTNENLDLVQQGFEAEPVINCASTGTTLNKLAKWSSSGGVPCAVITSHTTDTQGTIGCVQGGAGTSGSPQIMWAGQGACTFDGGTTVNDWVVMSTTVDGDVHDSGVSCTTSPPTTPQVIGCVLSTNAGGGTYEMFFNLSLGLAGSGGSGYNQIQVGGTNITKQQTVNFIQSGNATVSCVNNGGSSRTDCTFGTSTSADPITSWTGDGSDGTATFDGSATVCGVAPVSSTYTLTRDCYFNASGWTLNSGVTVKMQGFAIFSQGAAVINGTLSNFTVSNGGNGGNATGTNNSTGGTAGASAGGPASGSLPGGLGGAGGKAGANGGTGVGANGTTGNTGTSKTATLVSTSCTVGKGGGTGGSGSNGAGGSAGGTNGAATSTLDARLPRTPKYLVSMYDDQGTNATWYNPSCVPSGNNSGAAGGGDSTNNGGGGGGSGAGGSTGGFLVIVAPTITMGTNALIDVHGTNGGNGGNGGSPSTGNCGGGGGGSGGHGGSGGVIGIIANTLTDNSTNVNTTVASNGTTYNGFNTAGGAGGTAGTHGTGVGTGTNGGDGIAGSAGIGGTAWVVILP